MRKTITTLAAILALTACEKMNITVHPEPKKEPTGPKITYTKEGPCTTAQIEGLHTKSLTPTVEIKTRKGTDSLWGQTQPDGQIYISFCLENQRWLRRSLRKRSTTIIVTDEDGTKTTVKKGRY